MFNLSNLIPAEFRSSAKSSLVSFGLGVVFTVTVTGALIGLKRLAWVSQPPKLHFSDKLGACLEENIPKYHAENLPKYHYEAEQKILQRIAQLEEQIDAEKHRGQEEQKRLRRTLKSIAWESDKQELENNLYRFIVRPLAMQAGISYFKVIESRIRGDGRTPLFSGLEALHIMYYIGDTFTRYVIAQTVPSVITKYILTIFR